MTNNPRVPSSIESEAASWVAQLDSGLKTDADRIALHEWMARSPKHAAELRRLAILWGDIDQVLQAKVDQSVRRTSLGVFISAWFSVRPRQVYAITASFVAIIALALLAGFLVSGDYFEGSFQQTYSVATGEQRVIDLSDRSRVHLNTDSVVEVHYTPEFRVLRLLKGEAHFDVAHDTVRPFQVYAGQSLVTAIGTAFSVRLSSNDVSVIVTEGRVQLSDVQWSVNQIGKAELVPRIATERSVLAAGESAQVNLLSREVNIVQGGTSTDRRLAWRDGLVVFQNDTLQHVVDEVTRYTPVSIIIADPNIREQGFSGTFRTGEVTALLGALDSSFGINVEFADDNLVYLTRQTDSNIIRENSKK